MTKELAQHISDIFKMNGIFDAHEVMETYVQDGDVEELENKMADINDNLLLADTGEGEEGQKVFSKTMVACGGFICELRNLNSVASLEEWYINRVRHGLKFSGLGIDHEEWFNTRTNRDAAKSKLIRSLAKNNVLFV